MKSTLTFLLVFCFAAATAQDLNCLKTELYHPFHDVVRANYTVNESELKMLKPDSLQIIVLPISYEDFPQWSNEKRNGVDKGFKVIVINNSPNDFNVRNMDSRVLFARQVFYNDQWITLRSHPQARYPFCGNSFMSEVFLKPGEQLTYVAPCLEGTTKAKFRFAISEKNTGKGVYSNEFYGYLDQQLLKIN